MASKPSCGVVLIIGAPGSGKSVLGEALATVHSLHVHSCLNIGQQLRNSGKVKRHLQFPTVASKMELQTMARAVMDQACLDMLSAVEAQCTDSCTGDTSVVSPRILLLEGVKELDHAYTLMEALQQHDIPLLQTLLIQNNTETVKRIRSLACKLQSNNSFNQQQDSMRSQQQAGSRDADRMVEERQQKWRQHAAALIEFFSSMGTLVEVSHTAAAAASDGNLLPVSARGQAVGLSALGYADTHPSSATGNQSDLPVLVGSTNSGGANIHRCHSSSQGIDWLTQLGWCCPKSRKLRCTAFLAGHLVALAATPIQAVVSSRLITCPKQRSEVLQYAARCTGLCTSDSSSSGVVSLHSVIAVPSGTVTTVSDARWVAVPGRYCVSAKCDGTRHLLIVLPGTAADSTADGTSVCTASGAAEGSNPPVSVYLLNRSGLMYKYPVLLAPGTALLPGTVLDGELVWTTAGVSSSSGSRSRSTATGGGVFLVFDALSVGGKKVWQLPLLQRMAVVAEELNLPKASDGGVTTANTAEGEAAGSNTSFASAATAVSESSSYHDTSQTAAAAAAAAGSSSSDSDSDSASSRQPAAATAATQPSIYITKKQQAPTPGRDSLHLLLKSHYPVTPEVLQWLESSQLACPVPTDGLVFTPSDMPYVLGMSQLMYKWQPPQKTAVDMTAAEIKSRRIDVSDLDLIAASEAVQGSIDNAWVNNTVRLSSMLPDVLVYECLPTLLPAKQKQPDSEQQQQQHDSGSRRRNLQVSKHHSKPSKYKVCWVPNSVRWDKCSSNSRVTLSTVQDRLERGLHITQQQLQQAVQQVHAGVNPKPPPTTASGLTPATTADFTTATGSPEACCTSTGVNIKSPRWMDVGTRSGSPHPARCISFDELYAAILQEVAAGNIERWVDEESGLEVFCYRLDRAGPPPRDAFGSHSKCTASSNSNEQQTVVNVCSKAACDSSRVVTDDEQQRLGSSDSNSRTWDLFQQDAELQEEAPLATGPLIRNLPAVCRGLVLHPASSTVVATPFVRFGGIGDLSQDALYKLLVPPGSSLLDLQAPPPTAKFFLSDDCNSTVHSHSTSQAASSYEEESSSDGSDSSSPRSSADHDCKDRERRDDTKVVFGATEPMIGSLLDSGQASTAEQQHKEQGSSSKQDPVISGSRSVSSSSTEDPENLQLYTNWSQSSPAIASFKVDGSFIIAFMWDGRLRVTTRRRMNSEQASWASHWLQQHGHLDKFQPGWTYMFEAVYKDNTHVVQYPFEGLVLLGAVKPDGFELNDMALKRELAEQLGVIAMPVISGTWNELFMNLAVGCHGLAGKMQGDLTDTAADVTPANYYERWPDAFARLQDIGFNTEAAWRRKQPFGSAAGARGSNYEGWVLQESATGTRCKLVLERFKQLSRAAAYNLHPLVVWDAVFCGKSRQQLLTGLPPHYQAELQAILLALDQQFWAVQQQLHNELQQHWRDQATGQLVAAGCSSYFRTDSCTQSVADEPLQASSSSCSRGVSKGQQLWGPTFCAALQYAASKDTTVIASMFKPNSLETNSDTPALRGRILECIKPSVSGTLTGYTPSPAFQQTYAKGWAKGPQEGRMSVKCDTPFMLQLSRQCLESVLTLLPAMHDGPARQDLGKLPLVCRAWRDVLVDDGGFQRAAAEMKEWLNNNPVIADVASSSSTASYPSPNRSLYDHEQNYNDYGSDGNDSPGCYSFGYRRRSWWDLF